MKFYPFEIRSYKNVMKNVLYQIGVSLEKNVFIYILYLLINSVKPAFHLNF